MRHPTYKHLEARLRLGAFTLGQWAQITTAAIAAAVFGGYLSPLPAQATIFVAIIGAGLPVAITYGAMGLEFSVAVFVCAAWRYWRSAHRYLPGPGAATSGYVVAGHVSDIKRPPDRDASATGELVWDA